MVNEAKIRAEWPDFIGDFGFGGVNERISRLNTQERRVCLRAHFRFFQFRGYQAKLSGAQHHDIAFILDFHLAANNGQDLQFVFRQNSPPASLHF
jgi:hypothetical protein